MRRCSHPRGWLALGSIFQWLLYLKKSSISYFENMFSSTRLVGNIFQWLYLKESSISYLEKMFSSTRLVGLASVNIFQLMSTADSSPGQFSMQVSSKVFSSFCSFFSFMQFYAVFSVFFQFFLFETNSKAYELHLI